MDVSAGVRRAGVERRLESGSPVNRLEGYGAVRQSQVPVAVRCGGQEVGAVRGLGFGGKRRADAAGASEIGLERSVTVAARIKLLRDYVFYHGPGDVRQAEIAAAVAIRQTGVIE